MRDDVVRAEVGDVGITMRTTTSGTIAAMGANEDGGDDVGIAATRTVVKTSTTVPAIVASSPSSAFVLCAGLDVLVLTFASMIPFGIVVGGGGGGFGNDGPAAASRSHAYAVASDVVRPLFPVALFTISIATSIYPWKRREKFWTILGLTMTAPFSAVTFRDGFVGDVLTSTVRPLQDVATTAFHLPTGLWQAWRILTMTGGSSVDAMTTDVPSPPGIGWLLHTVVLPGCTLSP